MGFESSVLMVGMSGGGVWVRGKFCCIFCLEFCLVNCLVVLCINVSDVLYGVEQISERINKSLSLKPKKLKLK